MTRDSACILVVEDDSSIRSFCRSLLRDEGYRVETAIDGADGLQQLRCKPDLILLDLAMPVMDGYEFLRRLRKMTSQQRTPVLVVTANFDHHPIDQIQGILRKPFEVERLLRHVAELVARS